jgi:hypothetical protein
MAENIAKIAAAAPSGSVSEAAALAAETFGPDEVKEQAAAIAEAWKVKLSEQTLQYTKAALALARKSRAPHTEEEPELAEPWAWVGGGLPPYPWWNVLLGGPYQPGISPGPFAGPPGPYAPHKIIAANEWAFMITAVWRNPAGINWNPMNPSSAIMMGALNLNLWFETINLTNCVNGPDFGPFVYAPLGGGFINVGFVLFPPGAFAAPPNGKPALYELNMTADVAGPIAGLPFAGFATWVYDPDLEPAIWPPPFFIPPGFPAMPHWQFERPARFMVYTP